MPHAENVEEEGPLVRQEEEGRQGPNFLLSPMHILTDLRAQQSQAARQPALRRW